ncbi:MAG: DNA-3-methyladenine glycosylase [Clostridiales bacterium]|nr:DNA-3-methyladenine glycosylase [Clostridiales bacterium]
MARLDAAFYDRDTRLVAQELLGKYLVRRWEGTALVCRITETEAYIGRMDKACHAYQYRRTARTEPLFAPPGHAYVYLIYGMYHCLNLVTEPEGEPAAVLIRGAQPVAGLAQMARFRYGKAPEELTAAQSRNLMNGPGKLCRALAITRADNLADLTGDALYVCAGPEDAGLSLPPRPMGEIHVTKRIGIDYAEEAADFPWRYYMD